MTGPDDRNPLEALTARIEAAKSGAKPEEKAEDHHKAAQLAWRMVIELVDGLGIGFGIGDGLDVLFGTNFFQNWKILNQIQTMIFGVFS